MKKSEVISTLAKCRKNWRALSSVEAQKNFRREMFPVLTRIEREAPADELWTRLASERELTPQMRIGEHLAVTRILMGVLP